MGKKLKYIELCVADALDNGKSALEELRDEVREVYDNMPESLQGGDRGQRLEECASILDAVDSCDFCDEVTSCEREDDEAARPAIGALKFEMIDGRKRRMSRAARRDEAVAMIRGAVEAIENALAEDDEREIPDQLYADWRDDIDASVDAANQLCDEVESADFPGMYG